MLILTFTLCFASGCTGATGGGNGGKLEPSQVFEKCKTAVGEVITYDKNNSEIALGTCFVYNASGYIMTNYHVIEDSYKIKIKLGETEYLVNK